jgi:hypothetical protein
VTNLANLQATEKQAIDFALVGVPFHQQPQVQRLYQFIRAEKPHFREEMNPDHLRTVLCVKPKQSNERILAQAGAFLLFGMTLELDTYPVAGITIERIQINGKKKTIVLGELDRMGFNDSTMFPEIEKAALYIRNKI